ncbi:response regulator [Azospirillum sp. INR13]|uniref:response regulator n=1 Tax=Azospirillum sp. INR13 TaxID=2596919 RepID=UPI001892375E|nr:response regulator [Azospirillum sp. INR13]MBF5093986.1 response regulator [Azospirillum sp. INR13]
MASGQLYALDLGQPLGDRKVLIADDSLYDQRILSRFLHWAGITRIACVSSGPELLSCIGAFDPDLLVMDADLACADDLLALCRELRSNPRWHDLPILVQGAQMTDQMRTLCFQAGATDLLGKPVNPGECIARVRYHLERRSMVQELRAFASGSARIWARRGRCSFRWHRSRCGWKRWRTAIAWPSRRCSKPPTRSAAISGPRSRSMPNGSASSSPTCRGTASPRRSTPSGSTPC